MARTAPRWPLSAGRWPVWLRPHADSAVARLRREGKSPWSDAVHVLWSVWIVITPLFSGAGYDARWLALTLASWPLFALLYAMTLLSPPRRVPLFAVALAALGLALLPWYPSGMSYFVFGCVALAVGGSRPVRRVFRDVIALNVVFVGWALALDYPLPAIAWMPPLTLIVCSVVQVDAINKARDAALRLSHDEVRRLAATAERERIGRDLHDLLGHTLSLVALKTELAGKLVERDPAAAQRELAEVTGVARDALSQVRSAVTGIRAVGLASEFASARLLLESDGVRFDHASAAPALPPEIEAVLAMTLREAVTNVHRHARASRAEATLRCEAGAIVLRVDDDGRGGAIVPGNGLRGMRERIEALGGRLRVDAAAGTRLEAVLPLPSDPAPAAPDLDGSVRIAAA